MNGELWRTRFREYLELRQFSPRTVESYSREMKEFFAFLLERRVESPAGITRELVEEYRTYLFTRRVKEKALAQRTQAGKLGAVKAFLRFLAREHYVLWDVAAGLELPRVPRFVARAMLSEQEVKALLEAPDVTLPLGLRDRAMLEVLYGTGVRNSELAHLTLDQVDLPQRELRIQRGKGGKSRVVPLGEEAAHWLEAYLVQGRPMLVRAGSPRCVFLTWRGLGLTRGSLSAAIRKAGRQAGLSKAVTPHLLRHSCATHMLRRGAGIRHLQELLGHECLSTTQRYTRLEVSDLRRVLYRYHPREQGERS
ncbi:MAG: tyrosine-type recombinase/integrase [Candidatus Eremiobacterota bacterium]